MHLLNFPLPNFKDPFYIIICSLIAFFAVMTIIFYLLILKRKRKQKKNQGFNQTLDDIILALGGIENIISAQCNMSRLAVVLVDYSKVEKDKLTQLGVSGIVTSSKKITLVIGSLASKIEEKIKQAKGD